MQKPVENPVDILLEGMGPITLLLITRKELEIIFIRILDGALLHQNLSSIFFSNQTLVV